MSPEHPEPGARTDRWDLAAGGTTYAPEHPLHLAVPGFWDAVEMGGREYSKLLCVSFVLDVGAHGYAPAVDQAPRAGAQPCAPTELFPYLSYWHWYPDRIEARYYLVERHGIGFKQQAGVRVFLEEKRYIASDGTPRCELSFDLLKQHPPQLHVVAWGVDSQVTVPEGPAPDSVAKLTYDGRLPPRLGETPFLNMLKDGRLKDEVGDEEMLLTAVHWNVALSEDEPVTLHVAAQPV